jgi:uncharacterized protein (PEP-CTERM system associated)
MRYGIESGDTVRLVNGNFTEFDERTTLRLGVNADYVISPTFMVTSGVDYIPAEFGGGRDVNGGVYNGGDLSEDILNMYTSLSMKINSMLTASLSYNYTHSSSDFQFQTFERNRISIGLNAQF